ncbi:hypothetical protein T492DRAFT_1050002 [Pavlovales sp. CCMP2436]|nr:hypothetical protein T492DRAFT_1050002 [Pavlovales sp. CCMP2436]
MGGAASKRKPKAPVAAQPAGPSAAKQYPTDAENALVQAFTSPMLTRTASRRGSSAAPDGADFGMDAREQSDASLELQVLGLEDLELEASSTLLPRKPLAAAAGKGAHEPPAPTPDPILIPLGPTAAEGARPEYPAPGKAQREADAQQGERARPNELQPGVIGPDLGLILPLPPDLPFSRDRDHELPRPTPTASATKFTSSGNMRPGLLDDDTVSYSYGGNTIASGKFTSGLDESDMMLLNDIESEMLLESAEADSIW